MIRIAGPPADAIPSFAVQGAALNNNGVGW